MGKKCIFYVCGVEGFDRWHSKPSKSIITMWHMGHMFLVLLWGAALEHTAHRFYAKYTGKGRRAYGKGMALGMNGRMTYHRFHPKEGALLPAKLDAAWASA